MKLEAAIRLQSTTVVDASVKDSLKPFVGAFALCEREVDRKIRIKSCEALQGSSKGDQARGHYEGALPCACGPGEGRLQGVEVKIEAKVRLLAAPISAKVAYRFLSELFRLGKLKNFGLTLHPSEIDTKDVMSKAQVDGAIEAIKSLGFTKKWPVKDRIGLVREDKTWPIIIEVIKEGPNKFAMFVSLHHSDTLNPKSQRKSGASFKKVVEEAAKTLGVRLSSGEDHSNDSGYTGDVAPNPMVESQAISKLSTKFGKPKVRRNPGMMLVELTFLVSDDAKLEVSFNQDVLDTITCVPR